MIPEILTAVVAATAVLGWPHAPTPAEKTQIATVVLMAQAPRGHAASDRCVWPTNRTGRAVCVVRPHARKAFAVRVRVWEDGSYRIRRR